MSERMKNICGAVALTVAVLLTISGVWNALKEEPTENNVGNGEAYTYHITAVIDDEIYGIPATGEESEDNGGIFLYADEVDFVLDEGDTIEVVWGAEEDLFESIEKVDDAEVVRYGRN
jgi:hypothetical protein